MKKKDSLPSAGRGADPILRYYSGIDAELRRRRGLVGAVLLFAAVLSGAVFLGSLRLVRESRDTVWVVDHGSTVMATMARGEVLRDLEAEDHVRRLHELLFNLAPSSESQKRNLEQSLHLSDRSVCDWWKDRSEGGYWARLVSANISQEIAIDSVRVSMDRYPYEARLWGKVFLTRESNITAYEMVSECRLTNVPRSPGNPHGLMAERFAVTRYESLGTRRRR